MLNAIDEGDEFDDVAGIAIEPPGVRAATDEDSGEKELDFGLAHWLSSPSSSPFTAQKSRSDSDSLDDNAASAQTQTESSTSTSKKEKSSTYVFQRVLNCQSGLLPTFPLSNYSAYRNMSQVELFELFWDELLVKMKLPVYFVRKGKNIFVADIAESRTSFGIIMVSG